MSTTPLVGENVRPRPEYPPIDEQIAELKAAGWAAKGLPYVWRSPSGALFLGPHQAWRFMKGRWTKST